MKQLLSLLGVGMALYLLYSNTINAPKKPLNNLSNAEQSDAAQQPAYDYVMEQLIIREYQADGKLASTLVSPKLIQITGQPIAMLAEPRLSINKGSSEVWQLTAERAEFDQVQQLMQFMKNVQLTQPQATFVTEQLSYDLSSDILKLVKGVKAEYVF